MKLSPHLQVELLTLSTPRIVASMQLTHLLLTIIEFLLEQSQTSLSVRKVILVMQRHSEMPASVETTVFL